MSVPLLRRRYRVSGNVQGVGFRYRAQWAAELLGLTGWAANCDDGTVELEVQGPADAVDRLLEQVAVGSRWISITGIERQDLPLVPGERSFRVRGYSF